MQNQEQTSSVNTLANNASGKAGGSNSAVNAAVNSTELANSAVSVTDGVQVVAVVFSDALGQNEYFYFAPKSARAGQYATVYQQPNHNSDAFPFKTVRITRDSVVDTQGKATKSVWGVFDESFAKAVQARTEELARIRAQLALKRKQFEEAQMYAIMAERDPEVAALLTQLSGFSALV